MMQQLHKATLMLVLFFASHAFAADSNDKPDVTINTPVMELLKREAARAIVMKHLPNLVEALETNYDAQDFFADSSLLDLSLDDNHVKGFDEELLEKIRAELNALSNND